ncbi:antiterminator LoaP [Paenibacillus illinoisensis]|uniref:antiterminator LoaP n=1 Tax=Paenibacillus illinoisensis TaxID=59845 RepID=UPI001C8DBCEB|nr:antiterminator LoaP [Paenibacillus illinoisensis]MBY0220521.1 antiterminator LoaP [Paenibacillus illinoisensis]
MEWYVLFVETGKETEVVESIHKKVSDKEIELLTPIRKVPERKNGVISHVFKGVFPGYVFLKTSMDVNVYYKLLEIPKIIRMLNRYEESGTGFEFYSIPENEMELILRLVGKDQIINYSTCSFVNSHLKVLKGPLMGLEDLIDKVEIRKRRVKIKMDLLGENRHIDLGIELI